MWGQLAGVIFSEEGFGGETWAAVTSCRARLVSTGHEGPSPTPTPPPTSGSEDFRTSVALVFVRVTTDFLVGAIKTGQGSRALFTGITVVETSGISLGCSRFLTI